MLDNQSRIALQNILGLDSGISDLEAREAIRILEGANARNATTVQVIRFQEAMRLLSVSRPTLLELIRKGHLERVYGSGDKHGIGISLESYNRFIYRQTLPPPANHKPSYRPSNSERRQIEREQKIRRIRWSYHFTASTTAEEKYQAIAKLVSSNKDVSVVEACLAAGVNRSTYLSYLKSLVRPLSPRSQRLNRAAEIISVSIDRMSIPPPLKKIIVEK